MTYQGSEPSSDTKATVAPSTLFPLVFLISSSSLTAVERAVHSAVTKVRRYFNGDLIIHVFYHSFLELESSENDTQDCDETGHECNIYDPPCQESQTQQINGK